MELGKFPKLRLHWFSNRIWGWVGGQKNATFTTVKVQIGYLRVGGQNMPIKANKCKSNLWKLPYLEY